MFEQEYGLRSKLLFLVLLIGWVSGLVEEHGDNTSGLAPADDSVVFDVKHQPTTLKLVTRHLESEDTLPQAITKRERIVCSNFTKQKKCKRAGDGRKCEWRTQQAICVQRDLNQDVLMKPPTFKPTSTSVQTAHQGISPSKTFEQSMAFDERTYGPAAKTVGQVCDAIDSIFDGGTCDKTVPIFWAKINLCKLASDLGIPEEVVETVVNSCPCLERAVHYLEQGQLEYILHPFDTSDSSETEFVHQAEGLVECFMNVMKDLPSHSPTTDAVVSYKNNKDEVIESLKQKGEILVRGKEVGTEFTSKLADNYLLCPPSERFGCILSTLTDFFEHSGDAICDSLGESLLLYLDYLFESKAISSLVDDLVGSLSTCMKPYEFAQIETELSDFMKTTKTLIETIHPVINVACKASFDVFPLVADVIKKVEDGDLNVFHAVEIIIYSVQASNVVDVVRKEIKSILPQLEAEFSLMIKRAQALVDTAIGSTFNGDCLEKLPNILASIAGAAQAFITQLKIDNFGIIFGAEPIDSSIEIHMDDLPCTRIVTQRFFGFIKVSVPEFYDCGARFDLSIPLPPEFVPFVRVKLIID